MRLPNILFILTDQQRHDTIEAESIQTPHLNKLAASSFCFERTYCTSPICTPSRASLLTGQWPHTHQCLINNTPLPSSVKTIAEMVNPVYRRAYYGKWHLGDELEPQHGFVERISTEDGIYRPFYSKAEYLEKRSDYHHFLIKQGFVPDATSPDGARVFSREFTAGLSEQYSKPAFLSTAASQFLQNHSGEQPFLLAVSFLEPHPPYWSPLNDLYDPMELVGSPAFLKEPEPSVLIKSRMMTKKFPVNGCEGFPLRDEQGWRRLKANYYGAVTLIDHAVGKILAAQDSSGLADNTLVVFTSDHGEMLGDHALLTKGVPYEEASRIPLYIHVPWLTSQRVNIQGNFSQVDLVPTLLELLGQEIPSTVQGQSRANHFLNPSNLPDDVILEWNGDGNAQYWQDIPGFSMDEVKTAAFGKWRTIITSDSWKLTLCEDGTGELYNLSADPFELNNMFSDPAMQPTISVLAERLRKWQSANQDTMSLPID